jgi:type I restriction enzyme M protein
VAWIFILVIGEVAEVYWGSAREKYDESWAGDNWSWFTRSSSDLAKDATRRFDYNYWDPSLTHRLEQLGKSGAKTIKELNLVKTKRGKSPSSALYVDEADGYALVVKAGTNISKRGIIVTDGDYIEKSVYDDMPKAHVEDGDILLSSTGDGTLGKCAVFREGIPAIFDGHVTCIRVDQKEVYPEYVCDYLRAGFGASQISRLFTGSTGLIEMPPDQVDRLLVPLPSKAEQEALSKSLRASEASYSLALGEAQALLMAASESFRAQ